MFTLTLTSQTGRSLTLRSIAGSGTTSVALRAILYYLCRNPVAYRKLRREVLDAEAGRKISKPITYAESLQLEYLSAVINETLRVHPSTGFILERIVPRGGATISDVYLPEGTIVGVNTWGKHFLSVHPTFKLILTTTMDSAPSQQGYFRGRRRRISAGALD